MKEQVNIPDPNRFPGRHLFRVFGIAISVRQIVLGLLAIYVMSLGKWLGETVTVTTKRNAISVLRNADSNPALVDLVLSSQISRDQAESAAAFMSSTARPWFDLVASAFDSVRTNNSPLGRTRALFAVLWSGVFSTFFGLAICRQAAIQFARNESGSFRQITEFGLSRWSRGLVCPLIPLMGAAAMLLTISVIALPGRVPILGQTWLWCASPLFLTCGIAITILLLAAAVGWPLMIAAIASDDCDGFSGLSRSYSLWTGRPFQAVSLATVALAIGSGVHFIATLVLHGTVDMTVLFVKFGAGAGTSIERIAADYHRFVENLVGGLGISLFWTSATIIYLVLRQSVDLMPLEQIAPSDAERPVRDPLPVVGMPAVDVDPEK